MTLTLTLHWWLVPALLTLAGALMFYWGEKEGGFMGGVGQAMIGFACWFAALVSVLTKVLA
jgi:hypothetical protein